MKHYFAENTTDIWCPVEGYWAWAATGGDTGPGYPYCTDCREVLSPDLLEEAHHIRLDDDYAEEGYHWYCHGVDANLIIRKDFTVECDVCHETVTLKEEQG